MLSSLLLIIYLIITASNGVVLWISNTVSNQNIVITLNINTDTNIVDITLSGPHDRWFGIGFGNTIMTNTYTIIAEGTNTVTEHKLGNHNVGTTLSSSITVLDDSIENNVRTINIRRNRVGNTGDYYTFPNTAGNIDIIWAYSYTVSTSYQYHGDASTNSHDTHILGLIQTTSTPSSSPVLNPTSSPSSNPSIIPTTISPTNNPSTNNPTTMTPTALSLSTTSEPSTSTPTTQDPTTKSPTDGTGTAMPTTSEPSLNPTTNSPTDSITTSQSSSSTTTAIAATTNEPSLNPTTTSPTDAVTTSQSSTATANEPSSSPTTIAPTTSNPSLSATTAAPTKYWVNTIDRVCSLDGSMLGIDVTINLDFFHELIQIIFECPLDYWCGIAFNASSMSDVADSIIVQPMIPYASEWQLGFHQKGTQVLINTVYDISIKTDTLSNTITMIRPLSNQLYTFKQTDDRIPAIYARSKQYQSEYNKGFVHEFYRKNEYYQCMDYTPTAMQTTSTPTSSPTMRYDICSNNKRCKYIILFLFDILYSFLDDTGIAQSGFTSIIISTMKTILNEWIPNKYNIDIKVTLSISTDAAAINGKMSIESRIGIEDDTVYTDINNAYNEDEIINDINSNLASDVNAVYTTSGFSIQSDIISDRSILNGTISTTSFGSTLEKEEEEEEDKRELWAFIYFDFVDYTLFDWIVLGGCIIFILLICLCCCWWINRMRLKNVPDTQMHTKTGRTRVSMFQMVSTKQASLRPQASLGFEYKQETRINPESPEVEPQPVYTSNYAATPNRNKFNAALTAATTQENKKYQMNITTLDEDEDDDGLDTERMSTQSFGASIGLIGDGGGDAKTKLIPEEEEQDDPNYDYEAQYDDNIATTSIGGGPPPVRGSMINRMNHENQSKMSGPPPIRGSMIDKMKQNDY